MKSALLVTLILALGLCPPAKAEQVSAVQAGILSHESVVTERYPQRVDPTFLPPRSGMGVEQYHTPRKAQTVATVGDASATGATNGVTGAMATGDTGLEQASAPRSNASQTSVTTIDVYSLSTSAHLLALPKTGKPQGRPAKSHGGNPAYSTSSAYSEGSVTVRKSRPLPLEWQTLIREASQIFGLEEKLLEAVIRVESGFDAWAESPAGAQGAMQIMPHTQIELGLIDPFDPRANIYAGAEYLLRQVQRFGDMRLALAAYNAGPANVEKYGGVPPFAETQNYVKQVMGLWQASN